MKHKLTCEWFLLLKCIVLELNFIVLELKFIVLELTFIVLELKFIVLELTFIVLELKFVDILQTRLVFCYSTKPIEVESLGLESLCLRVCMQKRTLW